MALMKQENSTFNASQLEEWRTKIHNNGEEFLSFCKQEHIAPDVHSVIPWSHWVTPQQEKVRFDTRFYLSVINENTAHAYRHDGQELVNSKWFAPSEVLDAFQKKELLLPPPTWLLLHELNQVTRWEDLASQSRDLSVIEPTIISEKKKTDVEGGLGAMIVALPGDPLHYEQKTPYMNRVIVKDPFTYERGYEKPIPSKL
jgi:hypothetical protein